MAEPLSVAAGIIGIVVPALHGARLLKEDVQKITDAPKVIADLRDDLTALETNLQSIQSIKDEEWTLLGPVVPDNTRNTIESCRQACSSFHGDLQRWTKRSRDGKLSWRDRTNIGFFKERQVRALVGQLQTCKSTFTSVVNVATLYVLHTVLSSNNAKAHAGIAQSVTRERPRRFGRKCRHRRLRLTPLSRLWTRR